MDLSINGTASFANGFIQEYKTCSIEDISNDDIEMYLPNFILRVVAPKEYTNEKLGQYTAGLFVKSILQRKLCGPSLLLEEQSSTIKEKLNSLWTKTESALNQYDLHEHKQKINKEIQALIGRAKQSLSDPTFVCAPVNFNDSTVDSIINDFEEIISDLMSLEKTNEEISIKYKNVIGTLGGLNPALDQHPPEVRVAIRLHNITVAYALLFDSNITSRTKSLEKYEALKDTFHALNNRMAELNHQIEMVEIGLFGQSKMPNETNKIQEALNESFIKN